MIDHETQVAEIAAFARCGLDEAETAARQFGAEKCLWANHFFLAIRDRRIPDCCTQHT